MKKLLLLLILFSVSIFGLADDISADEAQAIATRFMEGGCLQSKSKGKLPMRLSLSKSHDQIQNYYIFNRGENEGYVIVSGNDGMDQLVLGYSESGSLDYNSAPCNLRWLLDVYSLAIDSIRQNGVNERLAMMKVTSAPQIIVAPLLKSNFNQTTGETPIVEGVHPPAGCTATAASLIMDYWKWPNQGLGDHTNTWVTGEYRDFRHVYNWDNLNVDELQADLGTAMNMRYEATEASAYITEASMAMVKYFGYNSNCTHFYFTGDSRDKGILQNQLNLGRPVLFSGYPKSPSNTNPGHSFVCDGYTDNGYFHFNFGWGGNYNGYYYLHNIDPGDKFYSNMLSAVLDLVPSTSKRFEKDGYIYEVTGDNEVQLLKVAENTPEVILYGSVNYDGQTYTVDSLNPIALQGNNIETLRITGTYKHLDRFMFSELGSLKNVILEEGVESIGEGCFHACTALESVTYGASLRSIGESAFYECTSLKNISIKPNVTLYPSAFEKSGLESVVFEEGFKEIPEETFSECLNLATVTFPSSLNKIGTHAFFNCNLLTSITLPNNVEIADEAFLGCELYNVGNIENVGYLGDLAFNEAYFSGEITLNNARYVGVGNFKEGVTYLNLPDCLEKVSGNICHGSSFIAYRVKDTNPLFTSIDGVLFNKDMTELVACPANIQVDYKNLDMSFSYTVPNGVKKIATGAFTKATRIVYLPESIEYIDSVAFPRENTEVYCYAKTPPVLHKWAFGEYDGIYDQGHNINTLYIPAGSAYAYKDELGKNWWWRYLKEIDVSFPDQNNMQSISIYRQGVEHKFVIDGLGQNPFWEMEGEIFTNVWGLNLEEYGERPFYPISELDSIVIKGKYDGEGYRYLNFSDENNIEQLFPLNKIHKLTFSGNNLVLRGNRNEELKSYPITNIGFLSFTDYDYQSNVYYVNMSLSGTESQSYDRYNKFLFRTEGDQRQIGFIDTRFGYKTWTDISSIESIVFPGYKSNGYPDHLANMFVCSPSVVLDEVLMNSLKKVTFNGNNMNFHGDNDVIFKTFDLASVENMYMATERFSVDPYDYSDPEALPRHTQFLYVHIGGNWHEIPLAESQNIPFDGANLIIKGVSYPVNEIDSISFTKPDIIKTETHALNELVSSVVTDDYSISFSPTAIEGDRKLTVGFVKPEDLEADESVRRVLTYDISLDNDEHKLSGVVEIRIPMQVADDCVAGGTWFNPETQVWEPACSYYDNVTKEVVIIADHLSRFGAIECTRENYRNGTVTYMWMPNVNKDLGELAESLKDLVMDDGIDTEKLDNFVGTISEGMQIGLDISLGAFQAVGFDTPTLSVFNEGMGKLGVALSVYQIISAAYNGRDAEVAGNTLKLIFNETTKIAAEWIGGTVMTGCMASVAWVDYVLNKFAITAWEGRTDLYRAAMSRYYSKGNSGYRSYKEWYDLIYPIFTRPGITQEQLKLEVDVLVDEHSTKFWNDETAVAYYLNDARGLGWTGGGGINESMKADLSDEYYDMLMNYEIRTVMQQIQKKCFNDAFDRALKERDLMVKRLNQVISLKFIDSTIEADSSKYAGCNVEFTELPTTIQDPPNWKCELNKKGEGEIKFRLFPYLHNGFKPNLSIIDSKGEVVRNITYVMGNTGATIDVSDGVSEGISIDNLESKKLNIKMTPDSLLTGVIALTGTFYDSDLKPHNYESTTGDLKMGLYYADVYGDIVASLVANKNALTSGVKTLSIQNIDGLTMNGTFDPATGSGSGTFVLNTEGNFAVNKIEDHTKWWKMVMRMSMQEEIDANEDYFFNSFNPKNLLLDADILHNISGTYNVYYTPSGRYVYKFTGNGTYSIQGNYLTGFDDCVPGWNYENMTPQTGNQSQNGVATIDETFIF